MTKLFGIDIARTVADAMGQGLTAATLRHYTPGTRSTSSPTAGNSPTSSSHRARGFVDTYRDSQIDGTMIQRGDRKVVLLGASISPAVVPAPGDEVTIGGETFRIVEGGVTSDPARAVYECQGRAY